MIGTLMVFLLKVKIVTFLYKTGAISGAAHPELLAKYLRIRLNFGIGRSDHAPHDSPQINRA